MLDQNRKPYLVASLAALFLVLFTFPILRIFNQPQLVFGLPLLYVWIFGVWVAMVAMAGWLQYRLRDKGVPDRRERSGP